jgi:ligand-binding SRPBCC domain-containing protein
VPAHGFVNIGYIETKNNKRYFFEADMRPNAWINYSRFIHNDLAIKIKHYFLNLQSPDELFNKKRLDKKTYIFPYPSRLHWKAIVTNQYDCLKYINYSHSTVACI